MRAVNVAGTTTEVFVKKFSIFFEEKLRIEKLNAFCLCMIIKPTQSFISKAFFQLINIKI
jgi:hypothetical protein